MFAVSPCCRRDLSPLPCDPSPPPPPGQTRLRPKRRRPAPVTRSERASLSLSVPPSSQNSCRFTAPRIRFFQPPRHSCSVDCDLVHCLVHCSVVFSFQSTRAWFSGPPFTGSLPSISFLLYAPVSHVQCFPITEFSFYLTHGITDSVLTEVHASALSHEFTHPAQELSRLPGVSSLSAAVVSRLGDVVATQPAPLLLLSHSTSPAQLESRRLGLRLRPVRPGPPRSARSPVRLGRSARSSAQLSRSVDVPQGRQAGRPAPPGPAGHCPTTEHNTTYRTTHSRHTQSTQTSQVASDGSRSAGGPRADGN